MHPIPRCIQSMYISPPDHYLTHTPSYFHRAQYHHLHHVRTHYGNVFSIVLVITPFCLDDPALVELPNQIILSSWAMGPAAAFGVQLHMRTRLSVTDRTHVILHVHVTSDRRAHRLLILTAWLSLCRSWLRLSAINYSIQSVPSPIQITQLFIPCAHWTYRISNANRSWLYDNFCLHIMLTGQDR